MKTKLTNACADWLLIANAHINRPVPGYEDERERNHQGVISLARFFENFHSISNFFSTLISSTSHILLPLDFRWLKARHTQGGESILASAPPHIEALTTLQWVIST
jgi:hypothetical protein